MKAETFHLKSNNRGEHSGGFTKFPQSIYLRQIDHGVPELWSEIKHPNKHSRRDYNFIYIEYINIGYRSQD